MTGTLSDAAFLLADQRVAARFESLRAAVVGYLESVPEQQRGVETIATVGALGKLLAVMAGGRGEMLEYADRWRA